MLGFGGLPLLYMGDELALRNDYGFVDDPDARRRQPLGAPAARCRGTLPSGDTPGTVEHRVWHGLRHAIAVRAALPSLDASVETEILDPVNPAVLVFPAHATDPDDGRGLQHDRRSADPAALGAPGR